MDPGALRALTPAVIGVLVHRGADFASAEDSVQEALEQATSTWALSTGKGDAPADPKGWLVTVAWRKFLDTQRSEKARRDREDRVATQPEPDSVGGVDDTLQLFFLCAHPALGPAAAAAHLHEKAGDLQQAAELYGRAAKAASSVAERNHLRLQAARIRVENP